MSRILHAVRSKPWTIVAVVVAGLLSTGAAPAAATSEIEGVWSFQQGQVAIVPVAGGKFEGIVTSPTKFAECEHTVGEHMWTDMTEQADGSYWGLHQWFHGAPDCLRNTNLGLTAWRVVHEANGGRLLRVCFSLPETTLQPTISADGAPREPSEYAAHHVNYGCISSDPIAPLPVTSGTSGAGTSTGSTTTASVDSLTLPSAKQCLRPGRFTIRLKEPKYDPFSKVTIVYRGRKLATTHKGNFIVATVNLKGLSKNTFTVKVRATTVLGHHLSANRTYHLCRNTKPKKHAHTKKGHKKG
jgi:hypothetical protein